MRFARRCEGILSARIVFKMAREDPRAGYQVFVSSALMEYYCSKVSEALHHDLRPSKAVLSNTFVLATFK